MKNLTNAEQWMELTHKLGKELKDMMRIANNHNFKPTDKNGHDILTNACIGVVTKAMEIVGGQGYCRGFGLEEPFRDIQAAKYHPLQEHEQFKFGGEFILRDPLTRDKVTI
jgi:hypothetical protein